MCEPYLRSDKYSAICVCLTLYFHSNNNNNNGNNNDDNNNNKYSTFYICIYKIVKLCFYFLSLIQALFSPLQRNGSSGRIRTDNPSVISL